MKTKPIRALPVVLVMAGLLASCAGQGLQITDTPVDKTLAYFSGKGVAVGIIKVQPELDPFLTTAWEELMAEHKEDIEIPSLDMVMFYNRCLGIVSEHNDDPYGLIGDLGALLTLYGAEFAMDGQTIVMIQPVPTAVMQYFGMGYSNGRAVAKREIAK